MRFAPSDRAYLAALLHRLPRDVLRRHGTLVVCLAAAYWIGSGLGIVDDLRTLIGVGTGIRGASAIAAVTPVIGAAGVEVSYAVSTIFLFNVAAVLAFPFLGHLLGMHQHAFGLFAGTAVNDMSSVVAAATTYGAPTAGYAVVVKLTRTLMIIPICLGLTLSGLMSDQRRIPSVLTGPFRVSLCYAQIWRSLRRRPS
ncbi:hypothetical protein SHXM_09563 [Streptomyces hygroscopicus]|nr:hypothetical protein SHXM_09563 [Streptomyces hygroscopicus]